MCISKLDIPLLFLYVGAAPGTHTAMLIEMYRKVLPNLSWCLVDPRDFDQKLRKYHNVVLINDFFTDESYKLIKQKYPEHTIIYNCDIRAGGLTDERETQIWKDMQSQLRWHNQLKPFMTMLKIHFPYVNCESDMSAGEYLDAPMYFQAFAGQTSTEMRMVIEGRKQYSYKTYNFIDVQNKLYTFNRYERLNLYKYGIENFKFPGLDRCYDCVTLVRVIVDYYNCLIQCKKAKASHVNLKKNVTKMLNKIYDHCNAKYRIISCVINNNYYIFNFIKYVNGKITLTYQDDATDAYKNK